MIDRRKFLAAMLSACAAPMIVRASSLMKVRALPVDDFTTDNILVKGTERYLGFYNGWTGTFVGGIAYRPGDIIDFNGARYIVSDPQGT